MSPGMFYQPDTPAPGSGTMCSAVPVQETIEAALPGETHPGEGEEIAIKFGINFNSKTTP